MKGKIQIYSIGAEVKIGSDKKIIATIQGICIREDNTTYDVVWWDGDQRRSAWLYSNEIFENTAPFLNIGFVRELDSGN